jgi:hypothetical protein
MTFALADMEQISVKGLGEKIFRDPLDIISY